jgi:hypothetical protein
MPRQRNCRAWRGDNAAGHLQIQRGELPATHIALRSRIIFLANKIRQYLLGKR